MSYYTVRRDDSEIRVVICPKCSTYEHGVADVTKLSEVIPYKVDSYLLRLMQCNVCKTYFTFYREDGLSEIAKEVAMESLKKGRCDMKRDGKDCHGHSFYIVFKNKPPTISQEKYDELTGWVEGDTDSNEDEVFIKIIKNMPSVNSLVYYRNMIKNIDFDSMDYLNSNKGKVDDYFKE